MITTVYDIEPVAKPRMTRRDKWLKPPRPKVAKYWAFKAQCQYERVILPEAGAEIIFQVAMPKSWSKKKKIAMVMTGHQQTPDLDNFIKALLDSVYQDDSKVWHYTARKIWGMQGQIIITRPDIT